MIAIRYYVRALFADRRGATAIEYGLIAALVSVVIIAGLNILGPALSGAFTKVGNSVNSAIGAAP